MLSRQFCYYFCHLRMTIREGAGLNRLVLWAIGLSLAGIGLPPLHIKRKFLIFATEKVK